MLGPPPLPRTLEASVRDVASARAEVRASAIGDLVSHARGSADVRARALPLLAARLTDEAPRVRAAAAVGLGDLAATEHVTALLVAIEDDDAHVRQMALNALGEIKDPRALPRLRRSLRDGRPEVRYQALIAFTRVTADDEEIEAALLDAASDDDDAVVHIAFRLAEERLDAGKSPGERLLARARTLLGGGAPPLALVAAILLGKAGDPSAKPLIADVVSGKRSGPSPDREDERAAVELAGELGLRDSIPALERRAFGLGRWVKDTSAFHARIALARMGHPRASAEILRDLESNRRDVRSAAVVAAGRARLVRARDAIAVLTASSVDAELTREALALLDERRDD